MMNALQKALVESGLAEEPKSKKIRHKQFKCHKCGEVMEHPDWGNFMYCPKCESTSFFLFSSK